MNSLFQLSQDVTQDICYMDWEKNFSLVLPLDLLLFTPNPD